MSRFKNILLCTTAAVGITSAASAAEMSVRKAPPRAAPVAVAPAVNWTGCYIGGHAGYGWGRKEFSDEFDVGVTTVDTDGFLGGVQGGCNYQFHPNWVLGIEGTFSWTDIDGSHEISPFEPFVSGKSDTFLRFRAKTESIATVVGRLGFTSGAPWMVYGLGGIAWARDKYNIAARFFVDDQEGTFLVTFDTHAKETRTGWVAGLGLAAMFGPNWSGFLEYNFLDFGRERVFFTGTGTFGGTPGPVTGEADIDQQIHVIKGGINWHFPVPAAAAPVSAKY